LGLSEDVIISLSGSAVEGCFCDLGCSDFDIGGVDVDVSGGNRNAGFDLDFVGIVVGKMEFSSNGWSPSDTDEPPRC
jgi:hypothetical protein